MARLVRLLCFGLICVFAFAAADLGASAARADARPVAPGKPEALVPGAVPGNALGATPDSEIWRQLRHGQAGRVTIPDQRAAVLINASGEQWRSLRKDTLLTWGGALILVSVVAVLGFAVLHGKFKLSAPRTGRTIPRFSQAERWVHWLVASLFILLGLTGLIIMFGRAVLVPVIGKEANAVIANASLQAHNLLGPVFLVGLAIMLGLYLQHNFWQRGDFSWVLKGAFFSRHHPPSWKYNLGEKSWYWLLVFAGTAIAASGVAMIFPTLPKTVQGLQLAQIVHAICAVVLIAASLGHIYLGLWGVEGALESMTLGYVDETWGLEHHRWWAEDEIRKGNAVDGAPEAVLAAEIAETS